MNFLPKLWAVLAAAAFAGCAHAPESVTESALGRIQEEHVRQTLFYLASDSMKGRDTPSPQLDSAAAFIAREFRRSGLQPVGGSYFQRIPLAIVDLGAPNVLRLRSGPVEHTYSLRTDFVPFEITASRAVSGPVVFAGYGITAPEYRYDDYAGIDVKGKIVLVMRHEPGEDDPASVFLGKSPSDYSRLATKMRIAREHGAVGMLVATDPLNHVLVTPRGFPWPSLSRIIPQDALPLTIAEDDSTKIPVVHVGEAVLRELFGSVDSLRALEAQIDRSLAPRSRVLTGRQVFLQTTTETRALSANNVVGLLPGTDPRFRDELVIVGAHYDHVGFQKEHRAGERYIYNGADDNASGTCAVIEVAAALGALPAAPRRSVLCVAFAGEEKGLFGSEYYARAPLFPLATTVAMLNLDMVGRNAPDTLFLIGAEGSPDLAAIARREDSAVGFTLVDQKLTYGGSDHMSFMKRNIPDLFFHSGVEGVYHTVNDRPELIDTRKVARVARLVFLTAWHCANDTIRYQYQPTTLPMF